MKDLAITIAAPQVTLTAGRGTVTVSVSNKEAAVEHVVLTPLPAPEAGGPGVSVAQPLRDLAPGETAQFLVTVDATGATPGRHTVRFVAAPSDAATEEYADRAAQAVVDVPVPTAAVRPPARRFPWWVVAVAGALVVVVAVVAVVLLHGRGSSAAVPSVVGKPVATAKQLLTGAGFTTVVTQDAASATSPTGTVLGVTPAAGTTVATSTTVTLVVATAAPTPTATPRSSLTFRPPLGVTAVPPVAGESYAVAAAAVTAAGLVPAPGGQCAAPGGTTFCAVDSTSPGAGMIVPRGVTVTLVGHQTKFG